VQEQLVPENRPARFPPDAGADETNAAPSGDHSWFAAVAVSCGILGLFVLQVVLGPVTIVLSALAWHQAGDDPWARKLVKVGYGLGILDGAVWLVLESVVHLRLIPL
jgi:hypothetical protein